MPPVLLLLALAGAQPAGDFPRAVLRSEQLRATVMLPDPANGYYRGSRFDWAGVVGPLEFAGHTLFTPWRAAHVPTHNDSIVGPVEEFGMEGPLGYADARPGGTFVKIGVGELLKPDDKPYHFYRNYTVASPGKWTVARDGDAAVTFTHEVSAPSGFGYRYVKTVRVKGPKLELSHDLTNTGTKPIDTDVYNHHFLNVDRDPVGPNYRLTVPYPVTAVDPKERFKELVSTDRGEVRFRRPLDTGSIWAGLSGFAPGSVPLFWVDHAPSGVRFTAQGLPLPMTKFNVWAVRETLCPEPFHAVKAEPGKSVSWMWVYELSVKK